MKALLNHNHEGNRDESEKINTIKPKQKRENIVTTYSQT